MVSESVEHQMRHLNWNALCSIYIETTGEDARKCDIVEICVMLLDNYFKPSKEVYPFYTQIAPFRPESIDSKTASISMTKIKDCSINGLEPSLAADRFEEWVTALNLPHGKRLIPVCYNWPVMREYLITWLGRLNFYNLFNSFQYRDILSEVFYLNDYDNQVAKPIRYPRPDSLAYTAALRGVDFKVADDVMEKCLKVGDIYYRLLGVQRVP